MSDFDSSRTEWTTLYSHPLTKQQIAVEGPPGDCQAPGSHTEHTKDSTKRRRLETNNARRTAKKHPKLEKGQCTLQFGSNSFTGPADLWSNKGAPTDDVERTPATPEDLSKVLNRIHSHPSLTPYRKRLYSTLLSVPRGRYTTYATMSDFLDSSARAVGNGMRNNPFAPDVPCHRVLAANGTVGGFKGDWGKDGKFAKEKIQLLRSEGVRFDSSGKAIGEPFRKLQNFSLN